MPRFIEVPAELFYVKEESRELEAIGVEVENEDIVYEDSVVVINVDFVRMIFPSGGEEVGTLGEETAVKFYNEDRASYFKIRYVVFIELIKEALKQENCFIHYSKV